MKRTNKKNINMDKVVETSCNVAIITGATAFTSVCAVTIINHGTILVKSAANATKKGTKFIGKKFAGLKKSN